MRHTRRETTQRGDPRQESAEKVIEHFELGVKPWIRPWDETRCAGLNRPFNLTTGSRYHGINVLIWGIGAS